VVVEGEAGVGKTVLLRCAAAAAHSAGMTVLTARCAPFERGFPYGTVRQLLEAPLRALPADERAGLLTGPAAHAGAVLGVDIDERAPAAGGDPGFATLHGLLWLVTGLQDRGAAPALRRRPAVVRRALGPFLAYVAPRLATMSAGILATLRRPSADAGSDALDAVLALPETRFVRPQRLSAAGTERLLHRSLGARPEAPFVAACHDLTAGNPFLTEALAGALAADGVAPTGAAARRVGAVLPETVQRAVVLRLRPMGDDARRLARAVAVLGSAPVAIAAQLAGLEPEAASRAADELAAAGVLVPGRPLHFVHPLVASAVDSELPAGERATLHAAAARIVAEAGGPLGRAGAHLLAADPSGDPWAVELLDAAARDALARGAPDAAAALWRRALDEGAAGSDRRALLLELGRAETRANRAEAVEHLQAALAASNGGPVDAIAARDLGRALLMQGRQGEAVALLDDVLTRGTTVDDDALVELESELLTAATLDLSQGGVAPERLDRLTTRSEAGDAPARLLLAQRAFHAAALGEDAASTVGLALRAFADGALLRERGPEAPEVLLAANALVLAEAFDAGGAALDAIAEEARSRGSALGFANAVCWRSQKHFRCGDITRAEDDAATAIEVAGEQGWGLGLPAASAFLINAQIERGDLAGATATLERTGLADAPAADLPQSIMVVTLLAAGPRCAGRAASSTSRSPTSRSAAGD
jgi:hypothetical protein